jgi:hypothetical protein
MSGSSRDRSTCDEAQLVGVIELEGQHDRSLSNSPAQQKIGREKTSFRDYRSGI